MPVCYIISAGDCTSISIDKKAEDLIIAADKGLEYCQRDSIEPDVIIGDFDSLGYRPDKDNVIILPVEKDDTDTSFAVKYAMDKGFSEIVIFGGVGGSRGDHTFANIALLSFMSKNGCHGFLDCGDYTVTAITDGKISFPEYLRGNISVFSADTVSNGVTETGLFYNFNNAEVKNYIPVGVSNSFTGVKSSVIVEQGTLIIYFSGKFYDCTIDK